MYFIYMCVQWKKRRRLYGGKANLRADHLGELSSRFVFALEANEHIVTFDVITHISVFLCYVLLQQQPTTLVDFLPCSDRKTLARLKFCAAHSTNTHTIVARDSYKVSTFVLASAFLLLFLFSKPIPYRLFNSISLRLMQNIQIEKRV